MAKKRENVLWGIDLGGTKIEGVLLKSNLKGDPIFRERIPTEAEKGYEHIINQIVTLVNMMKEKGGNLPDKIGVSAPGSLDPVNRVMKNSNTTCINGKPLKADLEKALGIPVILENDANCFALAETLLGVVKHDYPDAKNVFGVIIGTGVGGGIVIEGKIISGKQGIAGEWGHNFLDESGGKCYCGKVGCVETMISGRALERYYYQFTGNRKAFKEIAALAESKVDPTAQKAIQRLVKYFGLGLSTVINILDPDVVVIGGGVGNVDFLYDLGVDAARQHVFNSELKTPIVKPYLGDSAGVLGAALLTRE